MRTYKTEARAMKRVDSLMNRFGVWTSVVRMRNGRFRLTFDIPD